MFPFLLLLFKGTTTNLIALQGKVVMFKKHAQSKMAGLAKRGAFLRILHYVCMQEIFMKM